MFVVGTFVEGGRYKDGFIGGNIGSNTRPGVNASFDVLFGIMSLFDVLIIV